MNNSDVLLQLIVRMDNAALEKVASTRLWEKVRPLLNDYFWYLRSQALAGTSLISRDDADWKRIYYTLLHASGDWDEIYSRRKESGILTAMNYLPALLVLEEVYGPPNWSGYLLDVDVDVIWRAIRSPEVLDYLLGKKYLELSVADALDSLYASTRRGDAAMARYLVGILDPIIDRSDPDIAEQLDDVMVSAIHHGNLELIKLYDSWRLFEEGMLPVAVSEGTSEILRYLIETHRPSTDRLTDLISSTYMNDNADTLETLLEYGADASGARADLDELISERSVEVISLLADRELLGLSIRDWEGILQEAIYQSRGDVVKLAVRYLPRGPIEDETSLVGQLRSAGGLIANKIVFDAVRSTPSLSPYLFFFDSNKSLARELVAGSDPTRWDRETLRVFSWALELIHSDRAKGAEEGRVMSRLFLAVERVDSIGAELERGDIYSEVLRLLFFRDVTSLELVDWMIARRDPDLILAARAVIHGTSPERAEALLFIPLMLSLLYPSLTLSDLTSMMRDRVDQRTLTRSMILAGVYLAVRR